MFPFVYFLKSQAEILSLRFGISEKKHKTTKRKFIKNKLIILDQLTIDFNFDCTLFYIFYCIQLEFGKI
jgi:hypothetical protein